MPKIELSVICVAVCSVHLMFGFISLPLHTAEWSEIRDWSWARGILNECAYVFLAVTAN